MKKSTRCFSKAGKPKIIFNTSREARQAIKDMGNHADMRKWFCKKCGGYHVGHCRKLSFARIEQICNKLYQQQKDLTKNKIYDTI